jgi:hypothetical protein
MDGMSDLQTRAQEHGWPADLLGRAIAAHLPMSEIQKLLRPGGPSLKSIERRIEAATRIAAKGIQARELTLRDLDSFASLWRNSSEKIGDATVVVEREPNPLAQFRLIDDPSITVLVEDGEVAACTCWGAVNLLVAGERRTVLISQGMRVRDDRRREGLGDTVRLAPFRALIQDCDAQFMFMRAENVGVMNFLKGVGFREARDRPQSSAVVTYISTRDAKSASHSIRAARPEDLAACAALINASHQGLDLFRPVSAELLEMRLEGGAWSRAAKMKGPHVYGWPDFWVIEDEGEIVACAGLWDRGRDLRERWTDADGQTTLLSYGALLDLGWKPGSQASLAVLVEHLAQVARELGRDAVALGTGDFEACSEYMAHLDRRNETRILEWTPFGADCPKELGRVHIDLRYW